MRICLFYLSIAFSALLLQIVLVVNIGATVRIMPLGDSITNGNSSGAVPDNAAYYVSYRKALWDKLSVAGYDVDFVGSLNTGWAVFGDVEPSDHDGHPGWADHQLVKVSLSNG